MSRINVEYNPAISKASEEIIKTLVTPSMISHDGTSCQYQISVVAFTLHDHGQTDDVNLIHELINDGVHFIEF
jgi:hypothetical protein